MAQCSRCLLDLSLHVALEGGACPNCGQGGGEAPAAPAAAERAGGGYAGAAPVGPGTAFVLFSRFWQTVWDIIFVPARFFSENAISIVSKDSLSSALAFAVIIQWLASFFNFLWRLSIGAALERRFEDLLRIAGDVVQTQNGFRGAESLDLLRSRAVEFLFGAGAIVLTPFTTLLKLGLTALLVHAAVRFFTKDSTERPHSYSATLKILAYSSAPWVLCVIPGIGMLAAYVLGFVAAVVGIREVYRTSTGRAIVVVAFPELLFFAFFIAMGAFFLFLAFGLFQLVS